MAHKREPRSSVAEPDLFGDMMLMPVVLSPGIRDSDAKAADAFKTISETADMLSLPQHVLRFWESKFSQVKPLKLRGGRRYYRPQDIETLQAIKQLLYKEGYTIKGARRAFTQVKKKAANAIMPETTRKPRRVKMEETPLLQPLQLEDSVLLQPKKEELRRIHSELLELRELIAGLPPLVIS